MPSVVFHCVNAPYEAKLLERLTGSYEVKTASVVGELLDLIKGADEVAGVVCNLHDPKGAEAVIGAMGAPGVRGKFPTVIFLSSLLTWAGAASADGGELEVTEATLTARRPALGALEACRLENRARALAARTGGRAHVIGVGSVYGGTGYDMEYIFRALWLDGELKVETPLNGENRVPMVHVDALGDLLLDKLTEASSSSYSAAVDGFTGSIGDFLHTVAGGYDASVTFVPTKLAVVDDIMAAPTNAMWNQDMSFRATQSTPVDAQALWTEFLTSNNLTPCKVVLAGPPAPVKEALAAALCRHLSLARVTVTSAVEFVKAHEEPVPPAPTAAAAAAAGGEEETPEAPAVPKSPMGQLQDKVCAELEAAYVAPKGGPAFDLATVGVTDELALKLSAELLQQCVAAQLKGSKKGYCLDLWAHGLGCTAEDLRAFCPKTALPAEPVPEVEGAAPSTGVGEGADVGTDGAAVATEGEGEEEVMSPAEPVVQYSYDLPEVIIELQVNSEEALNAWATQEGVDLSNPKMDKADAAKVADIKTRLEEYAGTLVDIPALEPAAAGEPAGEPSPESTERDKPQGEGEGEGQGQGAVAETAPEVPAHLRTTHPGVLEMGTALSIALTRLDVGASQFDVAALAVQAGAEVVTLRGAIGWDLTDPLEQEAEAEVQTAPDAQTEQEAGAGAEAGVQTAPEAQTEAGAAPAVSSSTAVEQSTVGAGGVASLDAKKKAALLTKTARLEDYLVSNVGTHLAECMVLIERERPADPHWFLVNFLQNRAAHLEEAAEAAARDRFEAILAQAAALAASKEVQ